MEKIKVLLAEWAVRGTITQKDGFIYLRYNYDWRKDCGLMVVQPMVKVSVLDVNRVIKECGLGELGESEIRDLLKLAA